MAKNKRKRYYYHFAEYNGFKGGTIDSKYRLSWNVPYQPGSLKVVGYKNGKPVATKEIKTAGKPHKIKLIADRNTINATGEDLSFITVRVEDKDGNLCPKANHLINFKVSGNGNLEAVGNGNSASLESFQAKYITSFYGKSLAILKATENPGKITLTATADNLTSATITIKTK